MQVLEYFFYKNLKFKLLNKFDYKSLKNMFKLKKILLIFNNKLSNLKIVTIQLLLIELITKKRNLFFMFKQQKLLLKIKAGYPVGCKIILSKKIMFSFLKKLVFSIYLFRKKCVLNFSKDKNIFLFCLKNVIFFFNLKKFYNVLLDVKKLNIILVFYSKLKKDTNVLFSILKKF